MSVLDVPGDQAGVNAAAVPGGLIANVSTEGDPFALFSLREGESELVRIDVGRELTFTPGFSVAPDGRLYVFAASWLAEVTF